MDLRRSRHVSGELGMSSMSDILFILLMFFLMTSTLVAPSALTLTLPGRSNTANKLAQQKLTDITIASDGTYLLNGKSTGLDVIQKRLESEAKGGDKVNVTVSPAPKAPIENVVAILDLTTKTGVNAILSTE